MIITLRSCVMAGLLCLYSVVQCAAVARAQITVDQARELAKTTVQSKTGLQVWSIYRREDIEEGLRSLAVSHKERAFVFLLSNAGYEFHGNAVHYHLPSEGPISWFVAVSTKGRVYGLSGLKDSQEELNKLAIALHLSIEDDFQATQYLSLYLTLDPENRRLDVVHTLLQLKQTAETQFTRTYGDFGTAEQAFERWWEQNLKKLSSASLAETASSTDKGFVAKFCIISGISQKGRGPSLLEVSLTISHNGQVGELKLSPAKDPSTGQ
jgi:hypothetical protein